MPFDTVADNLDPICTFIGEFRKMLEDFLLKLVPLCWTWQVESQSCMTFVKKGIYTISCLLTFIDGRTWEGSHNLLVRRALQEPQETMTSLNPVRDTCRIIVVGWFSFSETGLIFQCLKVYFTWGLMPQHRFQGNKLLSLRKITM